MKRAQISDLARIAGLHVTPANDAATEDPPFDCLWQRDFCPRLAVVFLEGNPYCDRHAAAAIAMFQETAKRR